ncbi:MAG: L-rhamnose mutarotase, partial [Limisphaerales bacterium]
MQIHKAVVPLILAGLIAGCAAQTPPERVAWVTGLKPDKVARYESLHAHVWPGVNKMIKECHIQN